MKIFLFELNKKNLRMHRIVSVVLISFTLIKISSAGEDMID
jgi:hypothetical protein